MNKMNFSWTVKTPLRVGMLCAVLTLLTACEQEQLPVGAELSISPETRTLRIADRSDADGNCFLDANSYIDFPIVLRLTNSEGSPLADAQVSVYLDYAGNTFPVTSTPVMALYDDRRGNNNGVIDDFELVSGPDDDIARVNTDYYGGDRPLLIRINTSCPYQGEVFAFTDGVTAMTSIDVTISEDSVSGSL